MRAHPPDDFKLADQNLEAAALALKMNFEELM